MDEKLLNLRTLGELRKNGYTVQPVRAEMRNNLLRRMRAKEHIMPGIVGYDDTVLPRSKTACSLVIIWSFWASEGRPSLESSGP